MGFEAYESVEVTIKAEIKRLNEIALNVWLDDDRSSFLKVLAEAWSKADFADKRILRSAWASIVVKYALEEEYR